MNELQMDAAQLEAKFGPEDPTPAVVIQEQAPDVAAASVDENNAVVESSPEPDKALEVATAALERDGWSKADISALSADRIKAIGAKRHENQEKVSSDYRDYYALKDAKKAESEKATKTGSDSGPAPVVDISAQLKAFETEFGPEAAKALEGVLGPIAKTVEGLRQQSETIKQAETERERVRLQGVASGVYPQAADEMVATAVFTLAAQLQSQDSALEDDAAVKRAAEMLRGPVVEPPKRAAGLSNVAQAQPRATTTRAMSQREREMQVLEAIERGVPRADLRKIYEG